MPISKPDKAWNVFREERRRKRRQSACIIPANSLNPPEHWNDIQDLISTGYYERPDVLQEIASYILECYGPPDKKVS